MTDTQQLIHALGGDEDTGNCLCPAYNDTDPSLNITTGRKGQPVFTCRAGCTQERIMDALREKGLWGKRHKPLPPIRRGHVEIKEFEAAHEQAVKLREASKILYTSSRYTLNDPSAQQKINLYFKGRGIDQPPPCAEFISAQELRRIAPALEIYGSGLKRYPAITFRIFNSETHRLQGVQLTYLSQDGKKNLRDAKGRSVRRFLGQSRGGYVIVNKLDHKQPLITGESVEKAAAVAQVTGLPAISALSCSNMPNLLPSENREDILIGDNDNPGRKGVAGLQDRLLSAGRTVRTWFPPKAGDGADDALRNCTDPQGMADAILNAKVERTKKVRALTMAEFIARLPQARKAAGPVAVNVGSRHVVRSAGIRKDPGGSVDRLCGRDRQGPVSLGGGCGASAGPLSRRRDARCRVQGPAETVGRAHGQSAGGRMGTVRHDRPHDARPRCTGRPRHAGRNHR
jgi:hypothetical protein